MGLAFHKFEGLGNDFVIIEAEREDAVSAALARELCDRRRGVGGDGVLLLLPPSSPKAERRMRVLNADGSVPEMCGNGLRCAVLHVARARHQASGELLFETDAGPRACVVDDRDGRGLVTVDMGLVRVREDVRVDVGGESWEMTLADAGNPHAVITRDVPRATIEAVGLQLATHARFPQGTNVEFARFRGADVDLVVWERGVGITLACGTGACATVAVGVAKGLAAKGQDVAVHLPGGVLTVSMRADDHAIMVGPARHVFSGAVA